MAEYATKEDVTKAQGNRIKSDATIRALPFYEKPYRVYDAEESGLFLYVSPKREKNGELRHGLAWRHEYHFLGVSKSHTLGQYPALTLKAAREAYREARVLIGQGQDPAQLKQQRKAQAKEEQRAVEQAKEDEARTFAVLFNEWYEQKAEALRSGTLTNLKGVFKNHLIPALGDRPIKQIQRSDLLSVLKTVEEKGHFAQARFICLYTKELFRFCLRREYVEKDVSLELEKELKRVKKSEGFVAITEVNAVAEMLQKIDLYVREADMPLFTKSAMKLFCYLPLRSSELLGLTWDEIDIENAKITIPASRMKAKKEHTLFLSVQAVAIFKELEAHKINQYALPSTRNDSHLSKIPLREAFANAGVSLTTHKIHGFRKTFSSLCREAGAPQELVERCLAHKTGSQVENVYNKARYELPLRRLIQWYSDLVDNLIAGNGMIDLDVSRLYAREDQ